VARVLLNAITRIQKTSGQKVAIDWKLKHFSARSSFTKRFLGFYNAEEMNPKVEIEIYCEPEDLIDPLEAHAPRVDAMAEDIQQNAFYLFLEAWEPSYVWMKKMTLPIVSVFSEVLWHLYARYERNNEDAPYDDYRVVFDLEWAPYRVSDYGNKKGWVLVCELIPPFHEIAIAEAGEDKNSIREA